LFGKFLSTLLFVFLLFASGGNVAKADGSFAVPQQPAEISIVKIQYTDNNSKAFIPQISGMSDASLMAVINTNLRNAILKLANPPTGSSLHGDAEVAFANAQLLGLHFTGDSFTPGTPHANKIDCGLHIDLTTGKIYALADLFKPGVNFEKYIQELCRGNNLKYRMVITGLWDGWTPQVFADCWTQTDGAFLLQAHSLRVYAIPSYATGVISGYSIPYDDLMDIIDTNGQLWKQIQGGNNLDG